MGRIWRARDRVLGRTVALKVPEARPGAEQRFAREIAILARLSHPSIVSVLDAGRIDETTPFLAMPFLAGRTLAAEVAAGKTGHETLLGIMPAVSAVAYAHSIGIVHRDLKPANLFVGPFGECTVLDWGLAVVIGDDPAGQAGGSEGYASAEQRAGAAPVPDHDVYALGALLRFVMTGTHRANAADRAMPDELRSIVTRAMAPSGIRYATAAELMADVQRYLAGSRVLAHAYSTRQRAARWLRRHRTVAVTLATATVVAAGIGAWSVWRIMDERDRALAAEIAGRAARERGRQLTALLLDEVHASVAELGRLDLAANLLTGLERHVESAPTPDDRNTAHDALADVVQQIELRTLMADIAIAKGDHDQALRHLAPVDASLAVLPPDEAMTAALRCESSRRAADAWRGKNEPDAAIAVLSACIDQVMRAPMTVGTGYPRFDTLHAAATAHVALGDTQRDRGDPDAALATYRAAGALFASAGSDAGSPDDRIAVERLVARAVIEERIGSLAFLRFQFAEAETRLRVALGHVEAAVARREHEASAQWLAAQMQVALANVVGERGRPVDKRALIEKAARIAEPLFAIDPTNDEHGRWMTILWRAMAETGPVDEAPALFDRVLEVSRRRSQLAPRSPPVLRDLGVDLLATADWLIGNSDPEQRRRAQRLCEESLSVLEERRRLLAKDSADPDIAIARIHCAEIAAELGDRAYAQRLRRAVIDDGRANATRADPAMLGAYALALAAYANDAPPVERRARRSEMDRAWGELRAIGADEHMASVRELAPWWRPGKENR
jgi:serine/threonine protein kinase